MKSTPAGWKELWLPVISYGREYTMLKIGEGTAKEGHGAAAALLGPLHRTFRHDLRHHRPIPGLARQHACRALAGQHVSHLTWDEKQVAGEEQLFAGTMRFRDVVQAPDGLIYLLGDESAPDGGLMVIEGL